MSVRNKVARKWVLAEDTTGRASDPGLDHRRRDAARDGLPLGRRAKRPIGIAAQRPDPDRYPHADVDPRDCDPGRRIGRRRAWEEFSERISGGGRWGCRSRRQSDYRGKTSLRSRPRASWNSCGRVRAAGSSDASPIVTRHGQPLSAALAQTQSLPHDVPGLEAAWKASLTPAKNTDKKGDKKPPEKPRGK